MEYQKSSSRIYHVPGEKMKSKVEGKRICRGRYYQRFNHKMETSLNLVQSNTHKGCSMLYTTDYNYKLRSVLGQEDDSTANKWTWFNKQEYDTFFVFTEDITGIGWLHQNMKSYWLYTWWGICTVCVNGGQYWIHIIIFPYINSNTPRIRWSFTYL